MNEKTITLHPKPRFFPNLFMCFDDDGVFHLMVDVGGWQHMHNNDKTVRADFIKVDIENIDSPRGIKYAVAENRDTSDDDKPRDFYTDLQELQELIYKVASSEHPKSGWETNNLHELERQMMIRLTHNETVNKVEARAIKDYFGHQWGDEPGLTAKNRPEVCCERCATQEVVSLGNPQIPLGWYANLDEWEHTNENPVICPDCYKDYISEWTINGASE